jgi:cell filamentation protein
MRLNKQTDMAASMPSHPQPLSSYSQFDDDAVIGVVGLPLLPRRFTAAGKRRLFTLPRARTALITHLPAAREEAMEQLQALIAHSASARQIDDARQEVTFLRHARGPKFQLAVLMDIGYGKIEPVIVPNQTSLERVREISAAIAVAINQQPRMAILRAIRKIHKPLFPDDVMAGHHRLATEFLANTAEANLADDRFAHLQRLIDQRAEDVALASGSSTAAISDAIAKATADIAERIRDGELESIDEL